LDFQPGFAYSLRAAIVTRICLFIERDVSRVIPKRWCPTQQSLPKSRGLGRRQSGRTGFTPSAFSSLFDRVET
jgi:hypothetical protein